MNWFFENKEILDLNCLPTPTPYGFIYKITHIPSGKMYLGRKNLYTERNVKLGKKELSIIKEERKLNKVQGKLPSKKKVIKESDWKTYYGSNAELKELVKKEGELNFKKEILMFCKDKKHLTYFETKILFLENVLENNELYYNNNILGKFYSKDFNLEDKE